MLYDSGGDECDVGVVDEIREGDDVTEFDVELGSGVGVWKDKTVLSVVTEYFAGEDGGEKKCDGSTSCS